MYHAQVRHEGVVHVLPEERAAVEGVDGDAVGSVRAHINMRGSKSAVGGKTADRLSQGSFMAYSFSRSSCDFFGMISSMCGSRSGYVSRIFARMPRWTDDLTLVFAPALSLYVLSARFVPLIAMSHSFLNIFTALTLCDALRNAA